MLNNTTFEYVFIRACIIFLRSIAPISIAYCFLLIVGTLSSLQLRLPWYIECIALAETLFYAWFFLYRKFYLQLPAVHPPLYFERTRRELVTRCIHLMPDHDSYISKWFLGADPKDVKRENIRDFFRWAFFNTALSNPDIDAELEEYVCMLEDAIGKKLEPGRGNVTCLRLTLDNVEILHRSLVWYFVRSQTSYYKPSQANELVRRLCGQSDLLPVALPQISFLSDVSSPHLFCISSKASDISWNYSVASS
jgi:hypothetical protein